MNRIWQVIIGKLNFGRRKFGKKFECEILLIVGLGFEYVREHSWAIVRDAHTQMSDVVHHFGLTPFFTSWTGFCSGVMFVGLTALAFYSALLTIYCGKRVKDAL